MCLPSKATNPAQPSQVSLPPSLPLSLPRSIRFTLSPTFTNMLGRVEGISLVVQR